MKYTLRTSLLILFAVAVLMTMHVRQPKELSEVSGVQVASEQHGKILFSFESTVSRREIRQVLGLLPIGGKLFFYDSKHRTISDPGAYSTLWRVNDDEFAVRFGNHGWSSEVFAITVNEAVEYFYVCHVDNLVTNQSWPYTKMEFHAEATELPKKINRDHEYESAAYLRRAVRLSEQKE